MVKAKGKMSQILLLIGFLLILVGIIVVIVSAFSGKGKVEVAAGGFIGPIPFGFFSSPQMFWIWLILFIVLLVIWFVLLKPLQGGG